MRNRLRGRKYEKHTIKPPQKQHASDFVYGLPTPFLCLEVLEAKEQRAGMYCKKAKKNPCLIVSVHANMYLAKPITPTPSCTNIIVIEISWYTSETRLTSPSNPVLNSGNRGKEFPSQPPITVERHA